MLSYLPTLGKAEAAKTLVWLAYASIAINVLENAVTDGTSQALSAVGKVNIPAAGFATKPDDEKCDGTEEVNENSVG